MRVIGPTGITTETFVDAGLPALMSITASKLAEAPFSGVTTTRMGTLLVKLRACTLTI